MSYEIMQFNLGTGEAQGYVLAGRGEHEGTSEPISVADMRHYATDRTRLATFLDYRFLRAHGKRIAMEMNMPQPARDLSDSDLLREWKEIECTDTGTSPRQDELAAEIERRELDV